MRGYLLLCGQGHALGSGCAKCLVRYAFGPLDAARLGVSLGTRATCRRCETTIPALCLLFRKRLLSRCLRVLLGLKWRLRTSSLGGSVILLLSTHQGGVRCVDADVDARTARAAAALALGSSAK